MNSGAASCYQESVFTPSERQASFGNCPRCCPRSSPTDTVLGYCSTCVSPTIIHGTVPDSGTSFDAAAACCVAGIDLQPSYDHNPAAGLYTIGFILIGSFFWVNLLTTAIVDNYSQLINQMGASPVVSRPHGGLPKRMSFCLRDTKHSACICADYKAGEAAAEQQLIAS